MSCTIILTLSCKVSLFSVVMLSCCLETRTISTALPSGSRSFTTSVLLFLEAFFPVSDSTCTQHERFSEHSEEGGGAQVYRSTSWKYVIRISPATTTAAALNKLNEPDVAKVKAAEALVDPTSPAKETAKEAHMQCQSTVLCYWVGPV